MYMLGSRMRFWTNCFFFNIFFLLKKKSKKCERKPPRISNLRYKIWAHWPSIKGNKPLFISNKSNHRHHSKLEVSRFIHVPLIQNSGENPSKITRDFLTTFGLRSYFESFCFKIVCFSVEWLKYIWQHSLCYIINSRFFIPRLADYSMLCNRGTGGAGSIRPDNTKIHVCFALFGIHIHEVINKKQGMFSRHTQWSASLDRILHCECLSTLCLPPRQIYNWFLPKNWYFDVYDSPQTCWENLLSSQGDCSGFWRNEGRIKGVHKSSGHLMRAHAHVHYLH